MRLYPCTFFAVALVMAGTTGARGLDFSNVTCGQFLASGRANMAAMFMFLRGYHSGRSGVIPYDDHDRFAGRIGYYCKQHPDANLIETSEQILLQEDRGL